MAKAHVVKVPYILKFKCCHVCGKRFEIGELIIEQTPMPIAETVLSVCFIEFNNFNDDMPILGVCN